MGVHEDHITSLEKTFRLSESTVWPMKCWISLGAMTHLLHFGPIYKDAFYLATATAYEI